MQKRFTTIDFLRAVGILGVIATHVFSYNLTSPLNNYIWNYLHFVITSFIFCSGYVMYIAYQDKVKTLGQTLLWYKKRLIRLLKPYFIYLFTHVGLVFLLPVYFGGLGIQKNIHYILQSIVLVGGINENWLPLLFIELALLFPLLLLLFKKYQRIFWIYISVGCILTIITTFYPLPYAFFRWVMWIPWSLVFLLSWYFAKRTQKSSPTKIYLGISALSSIIFLGLFMCVGLLHRSTTLIDNKYPPNLFYISYEFAISFALLAMADWSLLQHIWLVKIYTWLSSWSYALFFVHFLVADCILQLNKLYSFHFSVWTELLLVTGISILIILLWERIRILFTSLRKNLSFA